MVGSQSSNILTVLNCSSLALEIARIWWLHLNLIEHTCDPGSKEAETGERLVILRMKESFPKQHIV